MSLFYRKTRGLVNRSVHKTPTFIIEPFLSMATNRTDYDHANLMDYSLVSSSKTFFSTEAA